MRSGKKDCGDDKGGVQEKAAATNTAVSDNAADVTKETMSCDIGEDKN